MSFAQSSRVLDGVAHVHAHALRVDVGHRQRQRLAQAQPQAVQGEEEDPVARTRVAAYSACASVTLTMSGSRLTLGGRMKWGIARGLRSTCSVKNFQPYRSSLTPLQECAPSGSVKYSVRSSSLSASPGYEKYSPMRRTPRA